MVTGIERWDGPMMPDNGYYLEYRFKGQKIWHQRGTPLTVYGGTISKNSIEKEKEGAIDENTIHYAPVGRPRKPNLRFRVVKQTIEAHKEVVKGFFSE